jgi:hypothetical protein
MPWRSLQSRSNCATRADVPGLGEWVAPSKETTWRSETPALAVVAKTGIPDPAVASDSRRPVPGGLRKIRCDAAAIQPAFRARRAKNRRSDHVGGRYRAGQDDDHRCAEATGGTRPGRESGERSRPSGTTVPLDGRGSGTSRRNRNLGAIGAPRHAGRFDRTGTGYVHRHDAARRDKQGQSRQYCCPIRLSTKAPLLIFWVKLHKL